MVTPNQPRMNCADRKYTDTLLVVSIQQCRTWRGDDVLSQGQSLCDPWVRVFGYFFGTDEVN